MLAPRHACAVPVERGFVRLAHGRVHYRAAGHGPAVIALHESPRSSLSLLPVIEALSPWCRVIAPDTPGYGLSDPLTEDAPELEAFADALAAFMDAQGLERAGLYGAHTGAAIATVFAARYPERVSRLVLDGVSVFTPEEVEAFRTLYLPPYTPDWDGRHVMGLWSRTRDLYTWFPWYDRSAASRLAFDPPSLDVLGKSFLGFVQAGAHYHKAYIRAAAFDPAPVLARVAAPIVIMARPNDLIGGHLDRLSGNWDIRRLPPGDEAWRDAVVDAMAGGGDTAAKTPSTASAGGFLKIGDGWLNLYRSGAEDGALRVLLHDLPGDAAAMLTADESTGPVAQRVAFDLPGCGLSDPLASDAGDLDVLLDVLEQALNSLGLPLDDRATIVADGASAILAALWRIRRRQRGQPPFALEPINAPTWLSDPSTLPPKPPLIREGARWDGANLTGAWFQLRDRLMYDTPPGTGDVRRGQQGVNGPSVDQLDRLFRLYVEGPECASVLAALMDCLRRRPTLFAEPAQ